MMKPLTIALATLAAMSASPALALNCHGAGQGGGIGLSLRIGEISEADMAQLDTMRLRAEGIRANSVEYWNGCIRAWVDTGAGEEMQFYHPRTLRRVFP